MQRQVVSARFAEVIKLAIGLILLIAQCAVCDVARAQTCISVMEIAPVASTETSETLKGQCPIKQCYGQSCSCYDRLYGAEVTNTCQTEVTIEVSAGTSYHSGNHKLGKGAQQKYYCGEVKNGCRGVNVSQIEVGSEERSNLPRPSLPKGQSTSAADLEKAKKDADSARAKLQQKLAKSAESLPLNTTEKQRLKSAVQVVPPWCEGMVAACRSRNSSLQNLSASSRDQCDAYCNNLQIEKCQPSSTIQSAAAACTAGADRDQREAVEQARADKARRAAEAARRAEEERVPAGWSECSCPGDHRYLVQSGRAKYIRGVLYHPSSVGGCS